MNAEQVHQFTEIIKCALKKACHGFVTTPLIIDSTYGDICKHYEYVDESMTCTINQYVGNANLILYDAMWGSEPLVHGTFSLTSGKVGVGGTYSLLHRQLQTSEMTKEKDRFMRGLHSIFKSNFNLYNDTKDIDVNGFSEEVRESDVQSVVDQSYSAYIKFDHATENQLKVFRVNHSNLLMTVKYIEDNGKHDMLEISLDTVKGNHIKNIYLTEYWFDRGKLIHQHGDKPDGFDTAFARFMFLGSLQT